MEQYDLNTRLIDMTLGDLMNLIKDITNGGKIVEQTKSEEELVNPYVDEYDKDLVYGLAGIAQIFNCSITTANRIKKSGKIADAIMQDGRIIITSKKRALELFNKNSSATI